MNSPIRAPGLTADWLNSWLAALGATVLVPDLKLSWTDEAIPVAAFAHPEVADLKGLVDMITGRFPDPAELALLSIAAAHPTAIGEFPHKITRDAYQGRAQLSRQGDPSLGWIATDLAPPHADGSLQTSAFYAAGPGTVGSLHDRLIACREGVVDVERSVADTLLGRAARLKRFGLGFDYRRITSPTDPAGGNWVDPVVEVLAFYSFALHPVRGNGQMAKGCRAATRGWTLSASHVGALRWAAWHPLLGAAAIDSALEGLWTAAPGPARRGLWIAEFESVPYKPLATADPTRGYGSRRVRHER